MPCLTPASQRDARVATHYFYLWNLSAQEKAERLAAEVEPQPLWLCLENMWTPWTPWYLMNPPSVWHMGYLYHFLLSKSNCVLCKLSIFFLNNHKVLLLILGGCRCPKHILHKKLLKFHWILQRLNERPGAILTEHFFSDMHGNCFCCWQVPWYSFSHIEVHGGNCNTNWNSNYLYRRTEPL